MADKREVPIFIASSVKEFEAERRELSDFLDLLNEVHDDSDAQLVWDRPENMSHGIQRGGSQLPYDRKILNSRFFVLIVGQKIGEHTRREFQLALEQFAATDSPIILPYFYAKDGQSLSDEVLDFRDSIREGQKHYTTTFTDFTLLKHTLQLDLEKSGAFESETTEPDSVEALLEQVQVKVRREIENKQKEIEWTQK